MLPYYSRSTLKVAPPTPSLLALAEELRRDVTILAEDIGPRGTFAPDRYRLAQEFILSAIKRAGSEAKRHTWMVDGVECANLEITLPGTTSPSEVLVAGAHYDSIAGCPAANDNGSGVAGLLALVRAFAGKRFARTVRLVFFANEEPPFFNQYEMGSELYSRACKAAGDDITGMFCLETIGCYVHEKNSQKWPIDKLGFLLPTVGDFIAFVGPPLAKEFMKRCVDAFEAEKAFPLLAAAISTDLVGQVDWSDHRGFNQVGYPGFMITDTAPLRYEHYHLHTDTPEKLDYLSMSRVVEGVRGMLATLAGEP